MSLSGKLHALLFVSGEPIALGRLAKITGASQKEVREALALLREELSTNDTMGIALLDKDNEFELATKSEYGEAIELLTKSTLQENLSQASLEVLAIVAYRAPVTRSAVDAIRGVNCSFTLRNLLIRGLIERLENPEDAREYVYQPTFALLEKMGLHSLHDLPDYASLSQDARLHSLEGEKIEL